MQHRCAPCHPMSFAGHNWREVRRRRVPAWGTFSTDMPAKPDGTVEYIDYECSKCGAVQSDETLYSWRANIDDTPDDDGAPLCHCGRSRCDCCRSRTEIADAMREADNNRRHR